MAAVWMQEARVTRAGGRLLLAALLCLGSRLLPTTDATGPAGEGTASPTVPHRRFEYKYSFKGPHLVQGDGSVPFWVHTGSKYQWVELGGRTR